MITGYGRGVKLQARVFKESWKNQILQGAIEKQTNKIEETFKGVLWLNYIENCHRSYIPQPILYKKELRKTRSSLIILRIPGAPGRNRHPWTPRIRSPLYQVCQSRVIIRLSDDIKYSGQIWPYREISVFSKKSDAKMTPKNRLKNLFTLQIHKDTQSRIRYPRTNGSVVCLNQTTNYEFIRWFSQRN